MTKTKNEGFQHKYRVLEDLTLDLSSAYVKMVGSLNEEIARILGNARGVAKSEFYIGVDDGDDDLMKAAGAKPGSRSGLKQPKKAKAPAKAKAAPKKAAGGTSAKSGEPKDIKAPGSRGGKWWRDKHGHVRYGDRPTGDKDRKWTPISEDETKQLYKNVEAVWEYGEDLRNALDDALRADGFEDGAAGIVDIIRDARALGMSAEDYFAAYVVTDLSDEEAMELWGDVSFLLEEKIKSDEKLKKAAKDAIRQREMAEGALDRRISRSKGYIKEDFTKELMTGDANNVALKMLGLLADLDLLFLPSRIGETGESDRTAARRQLGRIQVNELMADTMKGRAYDLNAGQLAGLFVTARLLDVAHHYDDFKEGSAFSADAPGEASLSSLAILDLVKKIMGSDSEDDPSDKEQERVYRRLNEIGFHMKSLIDAFNDDQGGDAVGVLFGGTYDIADLFKRPDAAADIHAKVEEKKTLIREALEAQKRTTFKTPAAMKGGFEKLTKDLIKRGILKEGEKADFTDYQRQAIDWMATVKRGILGYDTGMGKTPISIGLMAKLIEEGKEKRGIMVMPKGLVKQWPNEIKAYFPDANVVTLGEGMSLDDRIEMLEAIQAGVVKADFVIMSASTVSFSSEAREKFRASGLFTEKLDANGEVIDYVPKKGVTQEQIIEMKREVAAGDRLAAALRSVEGAVFFDEAHHSSQGLKTPTNNHNIIAREFLKGREHSFLLTATPMPNGNPEELFHLMDLVHPGSAGPDVARFANKVANYEQRYNDETGKVEWVLSAHHDWEQASKDVAPFVFMKKKTDADVVAANEKAGMKLPKFLASTHELTLPKELEEVMAQAGDIQPVYWDEKKQGRFRSMEEMGFGAKFRWLTQMQQIAVTPKILLGDKYKGPQPKIEHMADLVQKHFSDPKNVDKPMVVFSRFPKAFQYAREELIKRGVDPSLMETIEGEKDADERAVVQDAVNAGKLKVVFVSVEAGGAGLNLQKKTDTMIFLDEPWTPAHKDQAVGRVHRTGNPNANTRAINIKLAGSLDQAKLEKMAAKVMTIEAMSYAKDGGEVASKIALASLTKLLGGEDWASSKSPEEIQKELDKLGLKGLVTADALKGKFDIKRFEDTVTFKQYLDFGAQEIEAKRQIVDMRLGTGKIDKEEHARLTKRLDRQLARWQESMKSAGKQPIVDKKITPVDPEPTFKLLASTAKKPKGLSEAATRLAEAMRKNGGRMTVSDYLNGPLVDRMVADHPEKEGGRLEVAAQLAKNRSAVRRDVEEAFRELRASGMLAKEGSAAASIMEKEAAKNAPAPKAAKKAPGKPAKAGKAPKGGKATPKASAKPTKAAASAKKPAPKAATKAKAPAKPAKAEVNLKGGWNFHAGAVKKLTSDYDRVLARGILAAKPKTYAQLSKLLFGSAKPNDATVKTLLKKFHKLGVLS